MIRPPQAPIRRFSAIAALLAGIFLMQAAVLAQNAGDRQGETTVLRARRTVKLFDFEETVGGRKLGEFESLPMSWYVMGREDNSGDPNFLQKSLHRDLVTRAGFPRHSIVRFDNSHKTSGDYSLHLALNGGSCGAFIEAGTLTAVANSDYLVHAKVRTTPLQHARARLVAYFIDSAGRRIDKSVTHTDLVNTEGQWVQVSLKLYGDYPQAAWIGMQVELLQPEFDPEHPLGNFQVVHHEVTGGAWFDDIGIVQLPHINIITQSPLNLIRQPHEPKLTMTVRDLTGQALTADVRIYDHRLREVSAQQRSVGVGEPMQWVWSPQLPRFGWYLVDMKILPRGVISEDQVIARELLAFLWLGAERGIDPQHTHRFVLSAEHASEDELRLLPALLDETHLGSAVVSLWDRETTLANLPQRQVLLDDVLHGLTRSNRHVVMSLAPMPTQMLRTLDMDAIFPVAMFEDSYDRTAWRAYLTPLTLRYAQNVAAWQLGDDAAAGSFYHPDWRQIRDRVVSEFATLVPHPQLYLPWPLQRGRTVKTEDDALRMSLLASNAVQAEYVGAYLEEWQQSPRIHTRMNLQVPDASQFSHSQRIEEFTRKMLYAWQANVNEIGVNKPWTRGNERNHNIIPDPLLGVYATVSQRLGGRKVVGHLPLPPGMQGFILDGVSSGTLVVWNDSAAAEYRLLNMYLGDAPVAVDVWGNRAKIPLVDGKHSMPVVSTPIFIEDIDTELALFRSRFTVDDTFIESSQELHQRLITIHNPWPRAMNGRMRITEPADWEIQPRIHHFSIAAGSSRTIPISIALPVNETAGLKKMVASFEFASTKEYKIDLDTYLEVGLKNVQFDASLTLVRNSDTGKLDAVVTQIITNNGEDQLSIFAFARLYGFPAREQLVPEIQPGQTAVRRFTFRDVEEVLKTNHIRAGLRETNGPRSMNVILSP